MNIHHKGFVRYVSFTLIGYMENNEVGKASVHLYKAFLNVANDKAPENGFGSVYALYSRFIQYRDDCLRVGLNGSAGDAQSALDILEFKITEMHKDKKG